MTTLLEKLNTLDILLVCGMYGSGKTEFSSKYFKNSGRLRLSRNEIRKLIHEMTTFGDPWEASKFSEEDDVLVKHIERKAMEHYIHNKRKMLVVNTFATKKSRQRFIDFAKESKKTIGAIFLNMPLNYCLLNYKKQHPSMPEIVLRSMFNKIELPETKEGFTEVLVLHPQNTQPQPTK